MCLLQPCILLTFNTQFVISHLNSTLITGWLYYEYIFLSGHEVDIYIQLSYFRPDLVINIHTHCYKQCLDIGLLVKPVPTKFIHIQLLMNPCNYKGTVMMVNMLIIYVLGIFTFRLMLINNQCMRQNLIYIYI